MGLAGLIVGCFAVVLSVCLYFISKGHTDKRLDAIHHRVAKIDKEIRGTHKKKDK